VPIRSGGQAFDYLVLLHLLNVLMTIVQTLTCANTNQSAASTLPPPHKCER